MYTHNGNLKRELQDLVRLNCEMQNASNRVSYESKPEDGDSAEERDPLMDCVWEAAKELLSGAKRITIYEVCEKAHAGESAVRNRLNTLVDEGILECLPGSGRRPSYYFYPNDKSNVMPEATFQPASGVTDEEMLDHIKQEESRLLERLDKLQRDREAIERVIELRRSFGNQK